MNNPAIVESMGVLDTILPMTVGLFSSCIVSPMIVIIIGVTMAAPSPLRLQKTSMIVQVGAKEHPNDAIVMVPIPANSKDLGLYLILNAARNGATSNPANDAAVTICPATPIVVLKVWAISSKMNPVRIPIGLTESCDTNSEGTRRLFSDSATIEYALFRLI